MKYKYRKSSKTSLYISLKKPAFAGLFVMHKNKFNIQKLFLNYLLTFDS